MEKNTFKTERKKMKNSIQKSMKIKGKKRPKNSFVLYCIKRLELLKDKYSF